ncbi:MAG: hypothetical protein LUF78_02440 [Clostridiales bacterium]|nr:hypothetical protein [Clostridiales bacterium]MCD8153546.1 hypothetical protein [Clostridiales bacterium]
MTFSEYRLIDILTHVDMTDLESEVPEGDLKNTDPESAGEKSSIRKKRFAWISGIAAAGGVALTGTILLFYRLRGNTAA